MNASEKWLFARTLMLAGFSYLAYVLPQNPTLGELGAAIGVIAYLLYEWNLATCPKEQLTSATTWLIWVLIPGAMLAVAASSGGDGSIPLLVVYVVGTSVIAITSFIRGAAEKLQMWPDGVAIVVCVAALVVWVAIDDTTTATLLLCLADGCGFAILVRGQWNNPKQEPRLGWAVFLVSTMVTLLAVDWAAFEDWGFMLYVACGQTTILLLTRRTSRMGI